MMKISKIKTVRNVGRIRTLLITFSVVVCLATLMGCGTLRRQAAEQGDADAQYDLGLAYATGRGVPEDDVAAYAWWSVAAASGDDEDRKVRDSLKGELSPAQIDRGEMMATEISERSEKRKAAEAQ